jgi:hypothetical protein
MMQENQNREAEKAELKSSREEKSRRGGGGGGGE